MEYEACGIAKYPGLRVHRHEARTTPAKRYDSFQIDAILLGCTHYPLIESLIRQYMGNKIPLLDPANRCAQTTRQLLSKLDLLNQQTDPAKYQFFVSQDPEKFSALSKRFFHHPIEKTSPLIMTQAHKKREKNLISLLELKNKLNLSIAK